MDEPRPPQNPQDPPPPPQDYAARFRGPDDPAAAASGAAGTPLKDPPPQDAPGYLALLEAAVIAPVRPWGAFADAAARPAPSFAAMAAVVATYSAAFFVANLLHAAIAYPASLQGYPPERVAIVGAVGLVLALLGSFAAAGAFQAAALVCGGTGSYQRSYQGAAMLSALLLVESAVLWLTPAALLVPLLLVGVLGAAALEGLHGAKPVPARAVCGALVAVSIGAAWLIAGAVRRLVTPLAAVAAAQAQAQAALAAPQTSAPGDPAAAAAQATAALQAAITAVNAAAASGSPAPGGAGAPQAPSGLDMVAGPSDVGSGLPAGAAPVMPAGGPAVPGLPPGQASVAPQQMQALGQTGANLVGSILPMLQQTTAGVKDPKQKAQMEQMTAMLTTLQGSLQTGRPLTAEQRKQFDQQLRSASAMMQQYAPQIRKDAGLPPVRQAPAKDGGQ